MPTILISEPNASDTYTYLPYVWGLLKTSSERVPELVEAVTWLDPVYRRDTAANLLAGYDLLAIDVLGLSCYTWNFDLQCEIAALAKAANPDCLTVCGGPHPQIADPDFFRKHGYFDVVVSKDGEETFNDLLLAVCRGEKCLRGIPGLYLPDGDGRDIHFTGPPRLPSDYSVSPYKAQSDHYARLMARDPDMPYAAVWETNRGCPYSCSFCDWGSSTMSKIRKFDIGRVDDDIGWLIKTDVDFIFLADANFGILPRDVEIAEMLVEAMHDHGTYKTIYYSPAKNNPDRSKEISRTLARTGINYNQTLPVQHTDPEVLASVGRKNISPERQHELAQEYLKIGFPVGVQLIMGIPGDNYDKWKASLCQMPEWGLHQDYDIFFFNLLPNAPAAAKTYRDEWEIVTVKRVVRDSSAANTVDGTRGIPQEIIVGSKNFSTDEWVRMNAFTSAFRALHCAGMTRFVAMFLRYGHGVGYQQFYEAVIDDYLAKEFRDGEIFAFACDQFARIFEDEDALVGEATVPEFGDGILLGASHAVLVRLAMHVGSFLDGLESFIARRFPQVAGEMRASIIAYQRDMLVLPEFDPATRKRFGLGHDWPRFFADLASDQASDGVWKPIAVSGLEAHIEGREGSASPLPHSVEWAELEGLDRWRTWALYTMEEGDKIGTIIHKDVRIEQAAYLSDAGSDKRSEWFARLRTWLPEPLKATIMSAVRW